jgi:glycosyltransferase 2 family protein
VVGYAANNVLPARAGDAVRVFLMAPRAQASKKAVLGTLLAERLLDIVVILTLFVVVGYGLLGEAGGDEIGWIALATAAFAAAGTAAVVLVRRNERLHRLAAPVLSSTLQLRGRHGLGLLGLTLLVWVLEAGVWMSAGAAAGFPMDPIEGAYIVALASVFALIPSGPGYAGTQDAAAVTGILALGGTHQQALTYLLLVRFVIAVPITLAGLGLLAARYGGLRRLRIAR